MNNWLIKMAITYILGQLAKLGTTVDWAALKANANSYVNVFVPTWLQPSVDGVVDGAIDAVAAACADTADLQLIVDDLTAQNWAKALADLQALLAKVVHPHAAAAHAAVVALAA